MSRRMTGIDLDPCADLVRQTDKDRFLATLFAPEDKRPALFALLAFSAEIARVRDRVTDPMPGEMRFQWWRDVLAGIGHGDVRSHPVAAGVLDAIEAYSLPVDALFNLIEARAFDLYDDPMPTVLDLEGYCGETSSALIQLSSLILAGGRDPGTAEVAGHAGVAYAITGLLRAFPFHAARAQIYIPADILDRHGVVNGDIYSGRATPALKAALGELRALARHHLTKTRSLVHTIRREVAPAFLAVSLVEPYLQRMERADYDPFKTYVDIPQWRRQWILWGAARKATRVGA
jgi:15-cis-phytoene synthase